MHITSAGAILLIISLHVAPQARPSALVTSADTAISANHLRGGDVDNDGVADLSDVCCETPIGTTVDSNGRPLGDLDGDCDVDLVDFISFSANYTGPLPAQQACGPTCSDGEQNGNELGVDCGGECAPCPPLCITWMNTSGMEAVVALYASSNPNIAFNQIIFGVPELLPRADQPCVPQDEIVGLRSTSAPVTEHGMLRYEIDCVRAASLLLSVGGEGDMVLAGSGDDVELLRRTTDFVCGEPFIVTLVDDPPGSGTFRLEF